MEVVVALDADEATVLVAAGRWVVLVLPEGTTLPAEAAVGKGAPGRLAVYVGDPADPASVRGAAAMGADVFARPCP